MTLLLFSTVATAIFFLGAAYGARVPRPDQPRPDHTDTLHQQNRQLRAYNLYLRDEIRHLCELREVDAHDWPADAVDRLRADLARWDGPSVYDQDAQEG